MLVKLMKYEFKATARMFLPMYLIIPVSYTHLDVYKRQTESSSKDSGVITPSYPSRALVLSLIHI